jgi:hypothetical protein
MVPGAARSYALFGLTSAHDHPERYTTHDCKPQHLHSRRQRRGKLIRHGCVCRARRSRLEGMEEPNVERDHGGIVETVVPCIWIVCVAQKKITNESVNIACKHEWAVGGGQASAMHETNRMRW